MYPQLHSRQELILMPVAKARLPVQATCKKNNWKSGDWLTSSEWANPRRLMGDVGGPVAMLRLYREDGRALRDDYLRSFPPDTHKITPPPESDLKQIIVP